MEIDTFVLFGGNNLTKQLLMSKAHFLWVDDEIEIMKPYILFLEEKGYRADCASNGNDSLEM